MQKEERKKIVVSILMALDVSLKVSVGGLLCDLSSLFIVSLPYLSEKGSSRWFTLSLMSISGRDGGNKKEISGACRKLRVFI